ncbi:Crp/Fnr family transcriptional regulator [Dyadobacter sp. LHD-138]|uniref:Crp/Fnr family transcriptional regulator n=1 Tax=Dyadobacter sp. LHD-138 TaxID=3071413 RepID=UPI0027DF542F|nr:Crp/Fnr family transcriptional regulator [Dyadobacter sp. LHD-138]MDQ6477218.1 Crp/Fnr family transcriptional regulator [Dyadobacter sp. LHD-138]
MAAQPELLKDLELFRHLSDEEHVALSAICRLLFLPKKSRLVESGEMFDHVFVMTSGLLRWYFDSDEGTENNIFLTSEKEHAIIIGIPEFYDEQRKTKYNIEAVMDTQLLLFQKDAFEELAFQYRGIYQFYIKSLKITIDALRNRTEQLCSQSPNTRYETFLKNRSFITRNASRKHIANFLGITPNSLSRLTARLHKKTHQKK